MLKISLKAARVNAGMTQDDVAKRLHKGKQTILNWENGYSSIDTANLLMLCSLYGISEDAILLPKVQTESLRKR